MFFGQGHTERREAANAEAGYRGPHPTLCSFTLSTWFHYHPSMAEREQACSQACALCAAPRASLFRTTRVQCCRALTDLVIVRLRGHFSQRKACRADPLHAVSVGSDSSPRTGPPCLASAGRARRGQWGCGTRGGRIVGR